MQTQPDLFSNWYVAAITAYSAPQIVDGVITAGTRYAFNDATEEEIAVATKPHKCGGCSGGCGDCGGGCGEDSCNDGGCGHCQHDA